MMTTFVTCVEGFVLASDVKLINVLTFVGPRQQPAPCSIDCAGEEAVGVVGRCLLHARLQLRCAGAASPHCQEAIPLTSLIWVGSYDGRPISLACHNEAESRRKLAEGTGLARLAAQRRARSTINGMDTHETTVRLLDLRERFDHARQGKPLSAFGRAHAQLVAAETPPGEGRAQAAKPPVENGASSAGTDVADG